MAYGSLPNTSGASLLASMPLTIPVSEDINDITVEDTGFSYSPPDPISGDSTL